MRNVKGLLPVLVPPLASGFIRLVRRLTRMETIGAEIPESFWQREEHVILAFWHDQLLMMVAGYQGPGAKILISASEDGELIARTMARFGQGAVRGSSSRGGRGAFRALLQLSREPFDLVFTPDGPTGPRHKVKEGVLQLARLSGRPVIPMAFACSRGRRLPSWDRFLFPFPFGRGVFSFGPPVFHDATETSVDFQARMQQAMEENESRARARLEAHGVSAV